MLANLLSKVVNARFPNPSKPRVVFTDRGPGFYTTAMGRITPEHKQALASGGFRAFAGDDAAHQPGNISDIFLHKTAVAWIRFLLSQSLPKKPRAETREDFGVRSKVATQKANANYVAGGLCKEFPHRIAELVRTEVLKLKK